MARSKFPGKPSKPVNRTRINVLPAADAQGSSLASTNLPQDFIQGDEDDKNPSETLPSTAECLFDEDSCKTLVDSGSSIITRRTVRRKRVCKRLIVRRSSLLHGVTSSSSSQKFKGVEHKKPTDDRDRKKDSDLVSARKIALKVKNHPESNNVVGKFVLPSRSVHSSRVIKPNKRFINVEAVNNSVRTFKKRVVGRKPVVSTTLKESGIAVDPSQSPNSQNVDGRKASTDETLTRSSCSNRRIILRQARLQLDSQTPIGQEGPFSSTNNPAIASPPGTVTCGVCGAVRFYRFVKQARKFNIYSCESCRKFISKMIKRQMCNKKSLQVQCLKGQGMCHVPPIVRSQHWKFRCAYKARCNACWLKMCLRSFQMPVNLKNNLTNLLPEFMRNDNKDTFFNRSLTLFSFHTNNKDIIKPTSPKSPFISLSPFVAENSSQQRPVRKRSVSKSAEEKVSQPPVSDIVRQKIDLKGPRVKHVCRSASIVLGQPLAVFVDDSVSNKNPVRAETSGEDTTQQIANSTSKQLTTESVAFELDASDNKENSHPCDNRLSDVKEPEPISCSMRTVQIETNASNKTENVPQPPPRREKATTKQSQTSETRSRKRQRERENNIRIDFWENYDPEEVCQTGFGLISSVTLPMSAICFLCGSAGRDPLLFCCLCCEPYHPFCLEQFPQNINANEQSYDWLCPRCTTCNACGEADKQKFNCQKCHKAYHLECFNTMWQADDRPTVCSTCLRCKSCGKSNITKFIGNSPLCLMCFRLRKKGNFCPLCQRCYDDNDYNTKMMECGKCSKWVHSKCEGLSEDQYQILSLLPDSVEFLCNICEPSSVWRKHIDVEMRLRFNTVLRLLSKNRLARNLLKWSPVCVSTPSNKNVSSIKKIQFSDQSDSSSHSEDEDEDEDTSSTIERSNGDKQKQVNLKLIGETSLVGLDEKTSNKVLHGGISIADIKNKLSSNEYFSLREFDENMEEILKISKSEEVLDIYHSILRQMFPWYNSKSGDNLDNLNNSFCDVSRDLNTSNENIGKCTDYTQFEIFQNIKGVDTRWCACCKGVGDGLSYEEGRLLYCGNNEWIHANCALWSSEVYEEIDGSLQNVHSAIARGRLMRCSYCKQKGASIGCCAKSCYETYHFPCAQTVGCYFMHDKTIFCSFHSEVNTSSIISSTSDFEIRRSVYIELDKRKKRFIEPKDIQFMVGSLCITNIGSIVPTLSDHPETIIPLNLECRRLFWSISEPWKLIPYVISTHIPKVPICNTGIDRNFTVDHTLPKILLEKKLKDILAWQKDIERNSSGLFDTDDDDEQPNENAADILSPELTDAILEELPHDLLDGISMQDIFPKLMSNEELLVDFKVTDIGCNGDLSHDSSVKKLVNLEDGSVNKDNKNMHNTNKISKIRNPPQRSCSVTLSCKVNNSNKQLKPQDKNMFFKLLQVDGACDNSSSSDSESNSQEIEDLWIPNLSDEPVKCERCQCTYRTQASYKRHLENCEEISTSESDSEMTEQAEQLEYSATNLEILPVNEVVQQNVETVTTVQSVADPYMVTQYESYSSFQTATQNNSNTQTFTQNPAIVSQNSELYFSNVQPEQKPVSTIFTQPITINQLSNHSQVAPFTPSTPVINQIPSAQPTNEICVVSQPSQIYIQPTCNSIVNQPGISIVQPTHQSISLDIQPQLTLQPITQELTPILNIAPSTLTLNASKVISTPSNIMTVSQNQFLKPVFKSNQNLSHKTIRPRITQHKAIAVKKPRPISSKAIYIPPGTGGNPSVVVHQLPSTTMIPTFLESFQQQTGQNLQYITTITPTVHQSQPPVMQLQPDGTLVNIVPSVQPTVILPPQRIMNDQLLVDNSGSLVWAPQPVQPFYYGFETIVQNTVLQSQHQFLPGTVPGVLTANSSYSSTTQVIQTSKLEPLLDVNSGGIVLLNSSPVVNSQPLQISQPIVTDAASLSNTPSVIISSENKSPSISWNYNVEPTTPSNTPLQVPIEVQVPVTKPKTPSVQPVITTTTSNSINLPVAPFMSECGIPTNVVPPTLKPSVVTSSSSSHSRPMNRVLPMPTNNSKLNKPVHIEKPIIKSDCIQIEKPLEKTLTIPTSVSPIPSPKLNISENITIKPSTQQRILNDLENEIKSEKNCDLETSLKLVFQKQDGETGVYKISNNTSTALSAGNLNSKNSVALPIVSLKPIKTNTVTIVDNNKIHASSKSSVSRESTMALTVPLEQSNVISKEKEPQRKVSYKQDSAIMYCIESQDGFQYYSDTVDDLWAKVHEAIQTARAAHNMPPLPSSSLKKIGSCQMLGLKNNALKYLLEQLPGAAKCIKYKPSFHRLTQDTDLEEEFDIDHPRGAIRCASYVTSIEPSDMFGWLASRHRKLPAWSPLDFEQLTSRRGSITNLPMAMRFRHLKLTSKQSVGVYRSKIHKRGLFCHRDIECGEMVIEYAGEVIRSILADKREKQYTIKGMGCYMFRIDENFVVDATMKGNAARFINHSCEPNCYSKVVEILGHKHIIIFALRKIQCGEELTYDYKFPFEEDKIPCTCGSRRCRKFLN